MRDFNGAIPQTVESLLQLPGVGRYTAGAIASIAFDRRAPILDGNVQRVLCRLDGITHDPRGRETNQLLWKRAEQILPRKRVGDFNSALMELGATVCTPRNPQCLLCPVREHCQAFAAGVQDKIPLVKKSAPTPLILRNTYCIRQSDHWLIERRPPKGRWAGMWQFVTLAADVDSTAVNITLPIKTSPVRHLMKVSHALTHRRYTFEVFCCDALATDLTNDGQSRKWVTLASLDNYPLPRPHVKIAEVLRQLCSSAERNKLPPEPLSNG
jgi:A/G-specific adenine glycosylase